MELKLKRIFKGDTYTIGKLFIDGEYFSDTLEDKVRDLKDLNHDGDFTDEGEGKIFGQTAIPPGKYQVVISYSPKFKKYLPAVLKVPGFIGIRIHNGSKIATISNTEGCIIVGLNSVKGGLTESTKYMNLLISKLSKSKGKSYITIE